MHARVSVRSVVGDRVEVLDGDVNERVDHDRVELRGATPSDFDARVLDRGYSI